MMVIAPLQLVHLNFILFKMTTDLNKSPKVEHVLVIVDHFMRYTRAYVTKDQKALIAAKTLYKGFISIFGAPKRILMDQGKTFTSEVVEQLCSQFRTSQFTTTAYHPQGNSQVEWAHQTLERMIGKFEDEYKGQWPRYLSSRCSILLDDESFFFFLEWWVDCLGFGLACLLSSLLTTTSSSLSASSASTAAASLMLTTWASNSLQMHWKIWPWCVASSSFGESGHTCRVYMASVSGAWVWFIRGECDLL